MSIWIGQTTLTEIEEAIREFLMQFRKNNIKRNWSEWEGPADVKETLIDQEKIRAEPFFVGIIFTKWAEVQH